MVGGVIAGTVEILRDLKASGVPCYALTNMEAETYPLRRARFPFLGWFDGVVVSGQERVAKPDPEIFTRLLGRFGLVDSTTLMIDDSPENVAAASRLGMQTVRFRSFEQLRCRMETTGLLA
jgi:2-haloacid dehalogenase